jgi:hypothetical protein
MEPFVGRTLLLREIKEPSPAFSGITALNACLSGLFFEREADRNPHLKK